MIDNSDYVLEFIVHHISCKNTSVRSSPLIITMPGCIDIVLNAKNSTVCKITYEKGKRLSFSQSHLINLKASFILVQGHGDPTIRAQCGFDFFELTSATEDPVPIVYQVEIGMDKPNGERFGIMYCTFQLMPVYEYRQSQSLNSKTRMSTRASSKLKTPRKINVSKEEKLIQSRTTPQNSLYGLRPQKTYQFANYQTQQGSWQQQTLVPETPINFKMTSSSSKNSFSKSKSRLGSSIHERYMKKNELWLGHHCSTQAEDKSTKRTLSISRASSTRSKKSSRSNYEWQ